MYNFKNKVLSVLAVVSLLVLAPLTSTAANATVGVELSPQFFEGWGNDGSLYLYWNTDDDAVAYEVVTTDDGIASDPVTVSGNLYLFTAIYGHEYSASIAAIYNLDPLDVSETISVTPPYLFAGTPEIPSVSPTAVQNFSAVRSLDSTGFDVNWDVPTDTGGLPVESYSIDVVDDTTALSIFSSTGSDSSYELDASNVEFVVGNSYTFSVYAVNEAEVSGDVSTYTFHLNAVAPLAVTDAVLSIDNGTATINWVNSYDGGSSPTYIISLVGSENPVAQSTVVYEGNSATFSVGDGAGETFTAYVMVLNEYDQSEAVPTNSVSVNALAPSAPTISYTGFEGTTNPSVYFSWQAAAPNGSAVTSYVVWLEDSNGVTVDSAEIPGYSFSYFFDNLQNSSSYTVHMYAKNLIGNSVEEIANISTP